MPSARIYVGNIEDAPCEAYEIEEVFRKYGEVPHRRCVFGPGGMVGQGSGLGYREVNQYGYQYVARLLCLQQNIYFFSIIYIIFRFLQDLDTAPGPNFVIYETLVYNFAIFH